MIEGVEIKGGASEFEAAVIAIVLDHIDREQEAAKQGRRIAGPEMPAWLRVVSPQAADQPPVGPDGV
jgi:hypothetical protein